MPPPPCPWLGGDHTRWLGSGLVLCAADSYKGPPCCRAHITQPPLHPFPPHPTLLPPPHKLQPPYSPPPPSLPGWELHPPSSPPLRVDPDGLPLQEQLMSPSHTDLGRSLQHGSSMGIIRFGMAQVCVWRGGEGGGGALHGISMGSFPYGAGVCVWGGARGALHGSMGSFSYGDRWRRCVCGEVGGIVGWRVGLDH